MFTLTIHGKDKDGKPGKRYAKSSYPSKNQAETAKKVLISLVSKRNLAPRDAECIKISENKSEFVFWGLRNYIVIGPIEE